MTVYIIIGSIVALILFLLLSHISFNLTVDNGLDAFLRFLFLKFQIPFEKKEQKKQADGTKELLKESKKDKNIIAKMVKEKGIRETVLELWSVFKPILLKAIAVFKKIKMKRFELNIVTASDNAATTALEYGGVCAVVFPALSFLKSQMNFPDKATKVHVAADYKADKPTLYIDLKLKVRVITVLCAVLSVLWTILKSRFKKELNKQSKK